MAGLGPARTRRTTVGDGHPKDATTGDVIDLIARLGGAFDFDAIESQTLQVADVTITVATPAMLHEMKRDTVRPQDRADAAELRRRFGLSEGGG